MQDKMLFDPERDRIYIFNDGTAIKTVGFMEPNEIAFNEAQHGELTEVRVGTIRVAARKGGYKNED